MALSAGTRLGPYEIVSPLGAGGMGEVYRARDPKLGRDVALKILPDVFASDPDRLARFEREAQVLASLNHPNIAAIYGLEDSGSIKALVLELVDGPTLADQLVAGALALTDVLTIARQIADALEAAHEQGIVHRDLKPANVKLRPDGAVKVLDFGLAKLAGSGETPAYGGVTNSPTLTMQATYAGTILGTAAYMSPEQAKGKAVDRRADIWAFGVVLCEMLSGARMYDGETAPETLARVIEREPDLTALPASTPESIRSLLRRCLTKDPRNRLQAIGEARIVLDRAIAGDVGNPLNLSNPSNQVWFRALPWALAVALGVLAIVLWVPWRKPPSPTPLRMSVELGADATLVTGGATSGAAAILSPDGQLLAFVAQKQVGESQLYVRRLDTLQAMPLPGTEGARNPFFSPDGQWLAFFAKGKLKKIAVTGGVAVTVCDAQSDRGGSWAEDGTIVFAPVGGPGLRMVRVPSVGGNPEPFTEPDEGQSQRWPQVLPGGKALLYTAMTPGGGVVNLMAQPLPSGARRVVQRESSFGRYLPTGHLVYTHAGSLFAAPFDLDRLELTGPPVPVLEGAATSRITGAAQFDVSGNGTLVYVPSENVDADAPISWMDRTGKTEPLRSMPANWSNPAFAPDGRRVAVDIFDGKQTDIWVYEWARDTLSRLTFDEAALQPVWTPDGRRVAFISTSGGKSTPSLSWRRADGTGEVQRLTDSKSFEGLPSWHPSGKALAFYQNNPQTNGDLMILPMAGDESTGWKPGTPTAFLNTPANEFGPMFSPDGAWLAYTSDESGRNEVYVRPFPGPGGKWQISTGGGIYPTWSRTKRELLYVTSNQLMVVSYSVEGGSFRADKPRSWSSRGLVIRPRQRSYDLHPDGERVALEPAPETPTTAKQDKLVFVFNFFDELRRLAPTTRRSN
jgi:serine/threonine protein kinase/Tol biopolymer transport system component